VLFAILKEDLIVKTISTSICVSILSLTFIACGVPLSKNYNGIPIKIGKSPHALEEKLKKLQPGMNSSVVMKRLKINEKTKGVRQVAKKKEKREILFGTEIQVPFDQLEQYRTLIDEVRIFEIKMEETKNVLASFTLLYIDTAQSGPSLVAYLIFKEDKLAEVIYERVSKNKKKREYMTRFLLGIFMKGASKEISDTIK
jgi:hypothetical protein